MLPEILLLAGASLAISITTTIYAVGWEGLTTLGVFFDGHLYVEIAKSFPIPFGPGANDYLGQSPVYPAFIFVARLLTCLLYTSPSPRDS